MPKGARSKFYRLLIVIALVLPHAGEAGGGRMHSQNDSKRDKPNKPAMPQGGTARQYPLPNPDLPPALGQLFPPPGTEIMVNIPVRGFKRSEDENGFMRFEISLQNEKPVILTIPPQMLDAATSVQKKGLLPRKSKDKPFPDPCYFDSGKRFIEIQVTDFRIDPPTRLYTIKDRGYAQAHGYPGVVPTITFQVINKEPTDPTPTALKKDIKLGCELHVIFYDGLLDDHGKEEPQKKVDPESCNPWIKNYNPDALSLPHVFPFSVFPEDPAQTVRDLNPSKAAPPN